MLSEDFRDMIQAMSREFDEREGFVTCEVAIHGDEIPEFKDLVSSLPPIGLGRWVISPCKTCVKYHGEGYHHVEIARHDSIRKMREASNSSDFDVIDFGKDCLPLYGTEEGM